MLQKAQKGTVSGNIVCQFGDMNQDTGLRGAEAVRLVTQAWLLSVFLDMTEINRWMNQSLGLMYSTLSSVPP